MYIYFLVQFLSEEGEHAFTTFVNSFIQYHLLIAYGI